MSCLLSPLKSAIAAQVLPVPVAVYDGRLERAVAIAESHVHIPVGTADRQIEFAVAVQVAEGNPGRASDD